MSIWNESMLSTKMGLTMQLIYHYGFYRNGGNGGLKVQVPTWQVQSLSHRKEFRNNTMKHLLRE